MTAPVKKFQNKRSSDGPKLNQSSKTPFKPNRGVKEPARSKAIALQIEDDVPDFPRGGGSTLSKQERDEIHAEVDTEYELEDRRASKKKRRNNQTKGHSKEDDFGSLSGAGISGKLPRYANKITFKNISPGMKLWGVVSEVNEKDLVVSLPGGLRGLVRAGDAFDPILENEDEGIDNDILPRIFQVGQLVSCIVLQLNDDKKEKGKPKIWLSLRLSVLHKGFTFDAIQEGMVLTAYVKSIEDHGYILDFGLSSFTGFLPKNSNSESKELELNTGQLLQGVVRSIDKARKVVYLSCDSDTVSKYVTKDLKGMSIDLLVPGMMVNARVLSTLENGIMLAFLTYFTGTADIFHLESTASMNWKDDYIQNKKVNARILFIDPSTRAVGLTLNPHLIHNKAPPSLVKVGDIYDHSTVVRVDRGSGLMLEIPSTPVPTPAYVGITDVADEEVQKLEKKFKAGSHVRVRVLGFRHLEGIAMGVLKASALEGSVFTHSDVKPGMVVRAKIIAVDSFGAIVQISGGLKALCPLTHMSEFEIVKPAKKFKVGTELTFRVLGCKSKRMTVTHKKTLVKSKLGILSSYADATDGFITHGWITKIEKYGCFVRFYNGVQGFAPSSELGLERGSDPGSMYHVGQVVKCRVMSSVTASRRINLSFVIKPTRITKDEMIKLGSLVSGVVEAVTSRGVVVNVNAKGYSRGTVLTEHLADHNGLAATMKTVLKPGYELEQLLVLDIEGNNLILSAKFSLIKSAEELPSDIGQIRPSSILHGYICNIIGTGCFVRFLGRLTGFSPRSKAMDDQKTELSEAFYVGQSVRSNVVDVDNEAGRITLSLKQSCCSSTDASFIQEYFLLGDKIAKLQSSDPTASELKWFDGLNIGSTIEGKIEEAKDIGVVVSFEKYNDVLGFITQYQLGGTIVEKGSVVQAVVLDVAKAERLVDLSLKAEFTDNSRQEGSTSQTHKRKRKRDKELELHQTVNAIVEIVKENYLVLSIPKYNNAIGYASIFDFNTQKFPQKQFMNGQSVVASVVALPSPTTDGRLLLLLKSLSEATETSSSKRAKKKSSYDVGSMVQAEITEIKPLELRLKFGIGFRGRIHITEANDDGPVEDPWSNFRVGQTLTAKIVAKADKSDKGHQWELSIKPDTLSGEDLSTDEFEFAAGHCVNGYVYKVDKEWVWLTISRHVKAQLYILDSACEPTELQEFQKRFYVGKVVSGHVLIANKERKLLRLLLHPLSDQSSLSSIENMEDKQDGNVTSHIYGGDILGGRISRVLPGVGGLLVQIGPHLYGKVHFTELADSWMPNPLSGYQEGQFVKCKVLEISQSAMGTTHIDLSLRASLDGMQSQVSVEPCTNLASPSKRVEKLEDVRPNMVVQGYVKNVMSKGCFISLSRKFDAKILLSNLSDGFVDDPEKEFPVGKLVTGRVLSVEPLSRRIEVTLKSGRANAKSKSEVNDLSSLRGGAIISGTIKRVEAYGLFITIDNTNMVGLCHVSELSDDQIDNIEVKYSAGQRVKAKILKVDKERNRISLGCKFSYIKDEEVTIVSPNQESEDSDEENDLLIKNNLQDQDSNLHDFQDMVIECDDEEVPVLAQLKSRASIPALEVTLDDVEHSIVDDVASQKPEHIVKAGAKGEKNPRLAKKKAKEDREQEIRAAEQRLLEKDVPRTADDFEKLVRSSPNSSFIWIKYMAFMLSMADMEKARSIAERALRTINIREENEKLNVWLAYFNLENQYGNPPEEAVLKVFQRALQYCDPRKVHLALLGMYERTEQNKLVDELLEKMCKKFKHSCKVWLRRVQWLLKQQKDGVQAVVNRALLCLPKHKHIKFISQTAILEFKCGVPDRGRSMFEGMLREYPKRTDLWSVYLDQEIRAGDVDLIRALFERAISLSLPPKKMKFLFKKYLEYEKSTGDGERVESVKKKAMEYVESTLS